MKNRMGDERLEPLITLRGQEIGPVKGDTPKAVAEVLFSSAKENLLRDGWHVPMLFILFPDHTKVILVGELMKTPEMKDSLSELMHAIPMGMPSVRGLVLVNEAWAAVNPTEEELENYGYRASEYPNRREILVIAVSWADGRVATLSANMKRDKNEKLVAVELNVISECRASEVAGCRFTGVIPEPISPMLGSEMS